MKLQWYLTRYAKIADDKFELISYDPMPSFAEAQYKARVRLPNNEFYEVEHKVGSLLTPQHSCWIARDRYSHKPTTAEFQVKAELKAQQILDALNSDSFNVKEILRDMQTIKSILTKPQYNVLLDILMSKPCVIKILYERGDN